jgi:hypothetical protein
MAITVKVTAQTKSAGRGQSVGGAFYAWDNPNNIKASDNADTDIPFALSAFSDELWADSFNFALTGVVAVCGVRVHYECVTDFSTTFGFRLIKGGVEAGSVCARSVSSTFGDTIISAGASGETWGVTLTEADVEASGFGVSLNVGGAGGGVEIDHVQMTVHYTVELTLPVVRFDATWEAQSVAVTKVAQAVSPEFDREWDEVKLNTADPACEFGREWRSVAITSLTQIAAQGAEFGREWAATFVYDPGIEPLGSEFDREIGDARFYLIYELDAVDSAEFDFEVGAPLLRQFLVEEARNVRRRLVAGRRATERTLSAAHRDIRRVEVGPDLSG